MLQTFVPGSDAALITLFTLSGSVTGALAVAISPWVNRQLDRLRPTAQRGMKIIAALDDAIFDGDAALKFSWYDTAMGLGRTMFNDALTPAELKAATDWALVHFSAKAHEAKGRLPRN